MDREAKADLVLRQTAALDSDSIGFFAKDAFVTVQGCARSWCQVTLAGTIGFVLDPLLLALQGRGGVLILALGVRGWPRSGLGGVSCWTYERLDNEHARVARTGPT